MLGQGLGGPRENRPDKQVMERFKRGSDNALDMTLLRLGLYFGRSRYGTKTKHKIRIQLSSNSKLKLPLKWLQHQSFTLTYY